MNSGAESYSLMFPISRFCHIDLRKSSPFFPPYISFFLFFVVTCVGISQGKSFVKLKSRCELAISQMQVGGAGNAPLCISCMF